MITLEQLSQSYPDLPKRAKDLGITLKREYQDSDPDLEAIAAYTSEETPVAQTKKTGKKANGNGGAIARREQAQEQKQGAITAAGQKTSKEVIKGGRKEGLKLADQRNRALVQGFLEGTAAGMEDLHESILEMNDAITLIHDEAEEGMGEDLDFLSETADEELVPTRRRFSLL